MPAHKITKKALKLFLRQKLATDKRWALRALERIYERQTQAEKATRSTRVWNKVGFSGVHAEIMSSFAEQYARRGSLSSKQMAILQKIIPKYTRQIFELSNRQKLEAAYKKAQGMTASRRTATRRRAGTTKLQRYTKQLAELGYEIHVAENPDLETKYIMRPIRGNGQIGYGLTLDCVLAFINQLKANRTWTASDTAVDRQIMYNEA